MSDNLEPNSNRIAFVVNSATNGELRGGRRDVSQVYSLLTNPYLGRCSLKSPSPLYDCQDRFRFEEFFLSLLENWKQDNQLVFYYSGHGEVKNGKYGLVLGNSKHSFYPFENFINELEASSVKKAIIILDACWSGAALGKTSRNFALNSFTKPHSKSPIWAETQGSFSCSEASPYNNFSSDKSFIVGTKCLFERF